MKVKIHRLFELLLETAAPRPSQRPEAFLGFSLARSPRLGDFLGELDPEVSLDWSNESFQGLDALREHVVARSGLAGLCTADEVLITAGAAEANFLAVTQLVNAGDEIIVDAPGWPQPTVLGEALGATVTSLPRREENDWRFDLAELAELVTEKTRLIFLCNPSNPTGQVLREAELAEVVRLAAGVGAYLLCDEVYAGLEWQGPRVPSVAGLYERGISTSSVSKALGLQGLRIGWLISPDARLVRDAVILRENSSEIMNVLGERIAEIALREERFAQGLAQARAEGRANLKTLEAFIAARPELSWRSPAAGLIGLCRLDLPCDADELARRLLAPPYRTFVIPGSAYGFPRHLRLGVGGGPEARLETGLARLAQCLDDYAETLSDAKTPSDAETPRP